MYYILPVFLAHRTCMNFFLSSMFSFQNVWPIKRKAMYTLVLFFIHFLDQIRSQLAYFLKLLI